MPGKRALTLMLGLGLVVSAISVCIAQTSPAGPGFKPGGAGAQPGQADRRGPRTPAGGVRGLLTELDLSAAQEQEVQQILAEMQAQIRGQGNARPEMHRITQELNELRKAGAPEEEIAGKRAEISDLMKPMGEARRVSYERIKEILNDEQKEKFSQALATTFQRDAVQHIETDLGLLPAQQAKLNALRAEMNLRLKELVEESRQMKALRDEIAQLSSGDANQALVASKQSELRELQRPFQEVRKDFLDGVGKILDPEQQKRFRAALALRRQRPGSRGPRGSGRMPGMQIDYEAVFEKLGLSDQQKAQIAAIRGEMKDQFARRDKVLEMLRSRTRTRRGGPEAGSGPAAPGGRSPDAQSMQDMREAMTTVSEVSMEFRRRVAEILTAEQSTQFAAEMQKLRPMSRRQGAARGGSRAFGSGGGRRQ